ncbi:MAG: hypothetical protein ACI4AB_01015 [Acetatifactor sp.]
MENYQNTGSGLKKMFIAEIGAIICAVIMVIPLLGTVVGGIGAIVFTVISLVGLYSAGKDIEGCKQAFTLTIVNMVLSILGALLAKVAVLAVLISLASDVVSFLIVYLVCTSVGAVLKANNYADVAGKGETVWKINLVCYAVSIVVTILAKIPLLSILAGIVSFIVGIAGLVAGILYMIFLYKSYQAFGA